MKYDAHFHMYDLEAREAFCWTEYEKRGRRGMISHYSRWEHRYYLEKRQAGYQFHLSLGIHPQEPLWDHAEVLEEALKTKAIQAIGECGYDFFLERSAESERIQDEIFLYQARLAMDHGLPMVIHLRKAVDKMFQHKKILKEVPSLVFHSWPGPLREAKALLSHGVNAWFSFGNPLRQGNKKARECAACLPLERILVESDAPWQVLKGENFTPLGALDKNYEELAGLRSLELSVLEDQIADNYEKAYGLKS